VEKTLTDYFEGRIPEYETEHRSLTRQGDWIWVLERGKVFARDDKGLPARMAGTELDITSRKRADEALRLSETKFSRIISMSADAMVSIDAGQRITMFNAGAERIFGFAQVEVIGAPLDILIPERFRAAHRRHVEAFAAGADGARRMGERGVEIVAARKSGEEFSADASISKLTVDNKCILFVALRDITEQRRVEREQKFLAEAGAVFAASLEYEETLTSLARLAVRELAELCIVDIVKKDRDVRGLRVVCRNPSDVRACEALMHQPFEGGLHRRIRTVLETRKALRVEKVTPQEVASWAQDEEHRRVLRGIDPGSLMVVPLIVRGSLLGALALVASRTSRAYDETDLRLAEELAGRAALSIENARLYRAAQRATQARDDVMGMVAHDLRNPLGVILMQAPSLRQESDRGLQSRDPGQVIARAATRMNRLIQDLLDVTQMEAGRLVVKPASVLPEQIVRDSVEAQEALAAAASLELRTDVPPGVPPVWADHDRLLQVFENLITNAIKFTRPGGRITVGAALTDGHVLFRVADTGIGISPDDLPHVFDRFWQAHKGAHHGAGLGLPIVQGIVDAHGGRTWVDSQPGLGSTFFFTIPVSAQATQHHGRPMPKVA
jgi:PAS domain S-box-containing protein